MKHLVLFLSLSMALLADTATAFNLVAHRGVSKEAPENTLAAFQQAIDLGVSMIELDLRLSKDGIPIAIHDATIARTCGYGRTELVHELTLQELRRLDAGTWFHPSYEREKLPLLLEILSLRRGQTGLMLELKRGPEPVDFFAAAVADELDCDRVCNAGSEILVGSLDMDLVQALLNYLPKEQVLGIAGSESNLDHFLEMGLTRLSIAQSLATPERVRDLSTSGCRIWVWTVDDPEQAALLSEAGAEGIITNDPRRLITLVPAQS